MWGFDGVVMSDWSATYDGVEAANGGLDLEMPRAKCMNRDVLIPAIKDGRVSESTNQRQGAPHPPHDFRKRVLRERAARPLCAYG